MKNIIEKITLIILGMIIVGYSYYYFYLDDKMTSINALKKDIEANKQSIHKLENEKKTIDSKIEQEKNQSSEINEAVTDSFDKKEIIRYFYELIKNDGIKSDKISLTESKVDTYQAGSVSFKVTGNYESIRNFMSQIENEKRKFVIKQLNMSNSGDEYNASMIVEYYALPKTSETKKH